MKYINIDDYVPTYEVPFRYVDGTPLPRKCSYVKTFEGYNQRNVGVDPKKILDWRAVEKRTHELHETQRSLWEQMLVKIMNVGGKTTHTKIIMINHEKCIKVTDGSYRTEDSVSYLKNVMKDGTQAEEFVFVSLDEGGREIGSLMRKSDVAFRRYFVYKNALMKALKDRVDLYAEKNLRHQIDSYDKSWTQPTIVVVSNEGRTYALRVTERGYCTFLNEDVIVSV